jgi:flagellar biosynthetic protein FliQ
MNHADALDIVQSALWTVIVASGPAIVAAMAIGIIIALLQALTQVQEMTLTFVPKIVAILVICSVMAPFIGAVIYGFAEQVYARIEVGF